MCPILPPSPAPFPFVIILVVNDVWQELGASIRKKEIQEQLYGESVLALTYQPLLLCPAACACARRGSLPRASSKYRKLNELALGVVRPGGVLMSCSCSGAMTQSGGLGRVVQEAARAADRQVRTRNAVHDLAVMVMQFVVPLPA